MYAWGSNKYGLSGGKHGSRPSRIPTRVRPLSFRAVSVHSCFGSMNNGALDSQGRIWLWGSNQVLFIASKYALQCLVLFLGDCCCEILAISAKFSAKLTNFFPDFHEFILPILVAHDCVFRRISLLAVTMHPVNGRCCVISSTVNVARSCLSACTTALV